MTLLRDHHPMVDIPAELPECGADDVEVRVRWEREDNGGLVGEVVVVNVGGRACRLGGKPVLAPLKADGERLKVANAIAADIRIPGYVVLRPGQRAVASAGWLSWCGDAPGKRMVVSWAGGSAVAEVDGPVRPECRADQPENLSSWWFEVVDHDD